MEIVPGIQRIESILGPRPFSQYLLHGERTLLVDTGVKETPAEVILPFLADAGFDPAELDFDPQHARRRRSLRRERRDARGGSRGPLVCAHALDAAWIESRELILRERYGWYAGHGIGYDPETAAWLRDAMGPDVPVDVRLQGGEGFRLGPSLEAHVLHLPGHSRGTSACGCRRRAPRSCRTR